MRHVVDDVLCLDGVFFLQVILSVKNAVMQVPRTARIPVSGFFAELGPIAFLCAGFEFKRSGQGQG